MTCLCLFTASLPARATCFTSAHTWAANARSASPGPGSCSPALLLQLVLAHRPARDSGLWPLWVSDPQHLLSPPACSSVSAGRSLLAHQPRPLAGIFPKEQGLGPASVSAHFPPESSLVLMASALTCPHLIIVISLTSVLCYHFRRDTLKEKLTQKPEAIKLITLKTKNLKHPHG